ncbi:MAG TPA: CpsB/CapC family capsule biosynthesis tyrosine phosphatase [Gemmatimonadales bacterium]|nr:CpsB/CapC family capsule biosynthesis tyrosine phosphatase [Gemmatimonadales bacterium]
MIDLHSHLLPGVDDGSKSVEQSLQVLSRFKDQGIAGVCLTPHLLASLAPYPLPESHDRAFSALQAVAPPEVRLYRGAEIMLDRPLGAAVAEERRITLNASRYALVEFPRVVVAQTVEHAVANVVAIGLVPVVAHPERYRCCTPDAVRRWKALGALMQVDGPTLLSSRSRGLRARQLVEFGLADIAAADNHGDERSLRLVRDAFVEQGGEPQAELLISANPLAIVEDRTLEPVPPFIWRVSLSDRVKALFGRHTDLDRP